MITGVYSIGVSSMESTTMLTANEKDNTLKRLSRIEGQVRGVARMIDEERYCIDVLQQVQAIKAAIGKVEDAILKAHSHTCVASAIASGNQEEQRRKFNELVDLLGKYKR